MATVKKYNLAGVSANVELGKQGSYISVMLVQSGFILLLAHYKNWQSQMPQLPLKP